MTLSDADHKALVHQLAHEITTIIGTHYLPEDMIQAAPALVSLYKARAYGRLPEDVESVIGKIEDAVTSEPHFKCRDCNAFFHDTDDLGVVTKEEVALLEPGEIRPIGTCPICGGDVHPSNRVR